jgi:uncharacterized protein (TIGR02145 family)
LTLKIIIHNSIMKTMITICAAIIMTANVFAQAPQSFRYQAVARDKSGNVLANQNVSFRISILSGSISGTVVCSETHSGISTNAYGLIELEIGKGTPLTGDFSSIDWGSDSYFVKVEMDPEGGRLYQELSTSQLLSVPYALYSQKAGNGFPTGTAAGQMQYWNGSAWVNVAPGATGQVLTFVNGVPTWQKPAIPNVESTDVYNPATGKVWMDRNLGAAQVATGSTDAAAYGDLYQWGRGTDGHQIRTSNTTSTLSGTDAPGHGNFITNANTPYDWRSGQNNNLWQGVNGANNPCPAGYRLPTDAEWSAERVTWDSNNDVGAFASPLNLPVAGNRSYTNASLYSVGSYGVYWSGTVDGFNSRALVFFSSFAGTGSYFRANGFSVRCIKD